MNTFRCLRIGAALTLLLGTASFAPGQPVRPQTPSQAGFRPVDQVEGDVDPLRVSLRRVNPGLGAAGQESFVYRRATAGPGDDRLYYIRPGVTASFDRSEYFRHPDGPLLQMVPPNTVFHLGIPPAGETEAVRRPDHPLLVQRRVDRRVGTIDEGALSSVQADGSRGDYALFRRTQRQSVLEAIDRAVAAESTERALPAEPVESAP